MMKKFTRTLIDSAVKRFGYELRQIDSPPVGFSRFLEKNKKLCPFPKTVFDIGVGRGTPWLYDAFPQSHLVLVEPLPHFSAYIEKIEASRPCSTFRCALGRDQAPTKIFVPRDCPTGASLKIDEDFIENGVLLSSFYRVHEELDIDRNTLDSINEFESPFMVKIDAEGSELEILQGAIRTLGRTSMLIIELSIQERYKEEGSLEEIFSFLKDRGFKIFDIVSMAYGGKNRFLHHIDAVFVSEKILKGI